MRVLEGVPHSRIEREKLMKFALSPQHVEMLSRRRLPGEEDDPPVAPIVLTNLLPPPLGVDLSSKDSAWRLAHWGVRSEPATAIIERTPDDSQGMLEYLFTTAWAPPLAWVQHLSGVFPTLGIALHYAEPGNQVFGSSIFRANERIQDVDYSTSPAASNAFTSHHFGWTADPDFDDEKGILEQKDNLFDTAEPFPGVTDELLERIANASADDDLRKLRDHLEALGLTTAGANVLIARYASHLSDKLLGEILEHPFATDALFLRQSLPKHIATTAARMVLETLVRQEVPECPVLPQDILHSILPPEYQVIISALSEASFRNGLFRNNEAMVAYHDWIRRIDAWRRLLARCLEAHNLQLSRDDYEAAFRRIQGLDPEKEADSVLRNALIESLVLSPSTPEHILEAIRPVEMSALADRIAQHRNITPRLAVKLWELPLGLLAQAHAASHPLLAGDPAVVRAMLEIRASARGLPEEPHLHPYALTLLAVNAPVSELPTILEALASKYTLAKEPETVIGALETLPPDRFALVPRSIWTKLLQHEDREIRQKAMILLGAPTTTQSSPETTIQSDPAPALSRDRVNHV